MKKAQPKKKSNVLTPGANILQRKCTCGQHTGGATCESCKSRGMTAENVMTQAPAIVNDVLSSSGQPLDANTCELFESRLGTDFSSVRVHTDAKADESARAVGARAYTAGDQIAFRKGQYDPGSAPGRRLLAHELAHVVQQSSDSARDGAALTGPSKSQTKLKIGAAEDRHEHEADRVADAVTKGGSARHGDVSSTAAGIQMQPAAPQPKAVPPVAPNKDVQKIIEAARKAAINRTTVALMRLRGVVQTGPPDPRVAPLASHLEAKRLAQVLFQWPEPNMKQIEQVVGAILTRLENAKVMLAGPNDPECAAAAYVMGRQPPIILCPVFFNDAEQQVRTMIHEAAHLAGIGQSGPAESYCVFFDCVNPCGGFSSADSWAHFIHCLAQKAPDPTIVKTKPGGAIKPPAGGSKAPPKKRITLDDI